MSDFDYKEKRFEEDIEEYLITKGGYIKGDPKKFDRKAALDTGTFVSFIKNKIEEVKNAPTGGIVQQASPAEELKKFKELLDLGVITQEEFDVKKKQILGL